jgi:hypothetical protein
LDSGVSAGCLQPGRSLWHLGPCWRGWPGREKFSDGKFPISGLFFFFFLITLHQFCFGLEHFF